MGNDLVEKTELPEQRIDQKRIDQLYRRAFHMIHGGERNPAVVVAIQDELIEALARPATRAEIWTHLVVMLKSFLYAGSGDREAFVEILAEDVAAAQPSIGVVDRACRNLRRGHPVRYMPTINETLKALDVAERERRKIFYEFCGRKREFRKECWADEILPRKDDIIDDRI
jgi:hypothetical protein